jgi:uncharacterized membrane protein
MVESGAGYGIENERQANTRRTVMKALSVGVKGIVVVLPLPLAFFSIAPPEVKMTALYVTFFTLAFFVALAEIAAGLHRVAETLERQHRSP